MSKLYIALYVDNYRWWSRLIKWWTGTEFSHCEFFKMYDEDTKMGELIGISTEQSVRRKAYTMNNKWVLLEIPEEYSDIIYTELMKFYEETQGARYDWKGIMLSNIFNRRVDSKNKYTCSEWVALVLDRALDKFYPKLYPMYTPKDIFNYYYDHLNKNEVNNNGK